LKAGNNHRNLHANYSALIGQHSRQNVT
jgi:hypothetical protein